MGAVEIRLESLVFTLPFIITRLVRCYDSLRLLLRKKRKKSKMAIPTFEQIMPVVLELGSKSDSLMIKDIIGDVSDHFSLTTEERDALLPSGKQRIIYNRTYWATFDLYKSGLLGKQKKGVYSITERGKQVLSSDKDKLCREYLKRFPEYANYLLPKKSGATQSVSPTELSDLTPEERVEAATAELNNVLKAELLERVLSCSPLFFEKLIIDLMLAIGYGGSLREAGEHVGQSNDEGIDGVINEDTLGLDRIYLQAKRYAPENTVGRPALQAFAGSLLGKGANKGVFVSTSSFTKGAIEYVENVPQRIVLIDGEQLTSLMVEHGVGVRTVQQFELKKLDDDYYSEE